jgi:hypothetical protein
MRASSLLSSAVLAVAIAGCSDSTTGTSGAGGEGGGSEAASGGGEAASAGGGDAGAGGGASTGSTSGGAGPAGSTSAASTTGTTAAGTTSTTTGGGADPFEDERQLCVDTINQLRATEGLPPLDRWFDAEQCADESATSDEETDTPHGAFPACGEGGQNECLGHGPDGIVQCLNQMWGEKDEPECTGCGECHEQQGQCADCVFNACGHYVNMSALYFSRVACGFSALGGWDVQNFD